MEELSIANERLRTASDNYERDFKAQIMELDKKEKRLKERLNDLNEKRLDPDQANFNVTDGELVEINAGGNKKRLDPDQANFDVTFGDLVEINAGGKIISAKRSNITQQEGTKLETLFSGRWDKKLQRDGNGRIFLDVNPVGFRAIVDYLNELAILSEDNPPEPPSVADEHKHILRHQLELFGLLEKKPIESDIVKDIDRDSQLQNWLKEDGSDGDYSLLYRGSRDGLTSTAFHSKCDNQGCTITIIEMSCGFVLGRYSNTSWTSDIAYHTANKAFVFALSGSDIPSPLKMRLKNANSDHAVCHKSGYGPMFGKGYDIYVNGSTVYLKFGNTYKNDPPGQLSSNGGSTQKSFTIKDMEVFRVSKSEISFFPVKNIAIQNEDQPCIKVKHVKRFSEDINEAINTKHQSLLQFKSEIVSLENSFKDEEQFVSSFASGDTKDVVVLNVSGTVMATKRSTLQTAEGSVLASHFDDSRWTKQGFDTVRVKEWDTDDVNAWVQVIHGIPEEVSTILEENEIMGCELLALEKDGLMMLGITRTGTLCLLLEEIKKLKQSSQEVVTLIKDSPYCFGKILDDLRMKHLHSQWLADKPALPKVRDLQKSRFEKVVKYYFPGNSAKFILG